MLHPSPALAHAYADHSTPAPGAVLAAAPARVDIWFTEHLTPGVSTIQVYNTQRQRVDRGDATVDPTNSLHIGVDLQPLPSGLYTVVWSNVSADDGHPNKGGYAFTVALPTPTAIAAVAGPAGRPTAKPPPAETPLPLPSQSAQEVADLLNPATDRPTAAVDLVSGWLAFSSFVLTGGGAAFALCCLAPALAMSGATGAPVRRRLQRRFFLLTIVWTTIGALAALISLLAKAEIATGLPAGDLLSGTVLGALLQPWAGKIWIGREVASALTALAALAGFLLVGHAETPRAVERTALGGIAVLGAAGLVCQALDSHLAAGHVARQGPLGTLDLCLHLCAVGFWVGGLAYAALLLLPGWRRFPPEVQAAISTVAIARFSPLALLSVATIVVSGTYAAILLLPAPDALLSSAYGQALDVKMGLLIVLVLFGVANRRTLASMAREAPGVLPLTAVGRVTVAGRRLLRTMRGEFAVAAVVLLAAGTMLEVGPPGLAMAATAVKLSATVDLPPPLAVPTTVLPTPTAAPTPAPVVYTSTTTAGDLALRLTIDPALAGATSTFQVGVTGANGAPTDHAEVKLWLTAQALDLGTQVLKAAPAGPGTYAIASPALAVPGDWQALVVVRRDNMAAVQATFLVPVRSPPGAAAKTPAAPTATPTASRQELRATLTLQSDPPAVGDATAQLRLTDAAGQPVQGAKMQALWLMPQHAHIYQSTFAPGPSPGVYQTSAQLSMAGAWLSNVTLTLPDGRSTQLRFAFNVRDRGLFG